ncbi:glycosyltransferase [Poseidonocella sp. HB161398]|uniref:glycosyltransferase n=1 Tax=Poseidonocella sp. HB161398 TaxID=2320855 RepID=UPI0014871F94|nr:glycosyltransferase [Poseidonocella sp. HB161398]
MEIVYQTRFSYLGFSGWRGPEAGDAAALYDDARLAQRFALFERITLPGLLAQEDGDFCHVVLGGAAMPRRWKARLRALCLDTLGDARARVLFARPGRALRPFRRHVRRSFPPGAALCQVVLDDDDALAAGFTGLLRDRARAEAEALAPEGHLFLSFPEGLTLDLAPGRVPALYSRRVPYTNLGLALLARPGADVHPYGTAHRRIGERHPARLVETGAPLYLRSVHGGNDSRARFGGTPLDGPALAAALARFPFLPGLLAAPPAARGPSAAAQRERALAQGGSAP